MIKLTWNDFKSFINTGSINIQYIETSECFHLFAFLNRLEVSCDILKTGEDADLHDWNTNFKTNSNASVPTNNLPSFTSKKIAVNGLVKSLFARNIGKKFDLVIGINELSYTATFPWTKILGIECIGGQIGDDAELRVYDTPTGTFSGVPNLLLNQFGYTLNIAKDYYIRMSNFDSDVYAGMVLKITYNSISVKTIGINYLMNEVKS